MTILSVPFNAIQMSLYWENYNNAPAADVLFSRVLILG